MLGGRRPWRLGAVLAAVVVVAVVVIGWWSPFRGHLAEAWNVLVPLAAGLFAAVSCLWAARLLTGVERRWRLLMGVGLCFYSVGQVVWSGEQLIRDRGLAVPSWADLGFLTFLVFAFLALWAIAIEGGSVRRIRAIQAESIVPNWVLLSLDFLILTGSLAMIIWLVALGPMVNHTILTVQSLVIAIVYPVIDLVLVVMVLLMLSTQMVPLRHRLHLVLLGLGQVAFATSDSLLANAVAREVRLPPPGSSTAAIVGALLIGFAALTVGPAGQPASAGGQSPVWRIPWAQLLLPYLPLAVVGGILVYQELSGHETQTVQNVLGIPIVTLVIVRQTIVLVDNSVLLRQLTQTEDKLRFQAYHDPLTGLGNRALFRSRLTEAVERLPARRNTVVLYFVDLDDFKEVNDTHGHLAGDRVLRAVADRLRSCVRDSDTVVRLGGDEFGLLVEAHEGDPAEIGRRLVESISQPIDVDTGVVASVTASLGVAVMRGSGVGITPDQLQRRADDAMYSGKRRGKAQFIVYNVDSPGD